MLQVKLFGAGQACYSGRPLVGFPNQQCYHLLSYLLLNQRHAHHRERLAAVFWGEHSTAVSRKYLRNALWRLRSALEAIGTPVDEYLSIGEETVSFLGSGLCYLDVHDFEAAIVQCEGLPGQHLTPDQALRLERAVDLYIGELLEGIYDDWCLYDRERLRMLRLSALDKLLDYHEHHGTGERGIAYGKQVLALDPTREKVHRQMMRLYWRLGEWNEALAQYQRCAQILREELDILPTEETRLLHDQMASNRCDLASWPAQRDDLLREPARQDASMHLLLEQALEKLRRLEAMTEETRAELQRVALLIQETQAGGTYG